MSFSLAGRSVQRTEVRSSPSGSSSSSTSFWSAYTGSWSSASGGGWSLPFLAALPVCWVRFFGAMDVPSFSVASDSALSCSSIFSPWSFIQNVSTCTCSLVSVSALTPPTPGAGGGSAPSFANGGSSGAGGMPREWECPRPGGPAPSSANGETILASAK